MSVFVDEIEHTGLVVRVWVAECVSIDDVADAARDALGVGADVLPDIIEHGAGVFEAVFESADLA